MSIDKDCFERTYPLKKDRTILYKPIIVPKPAYLTPVIDPTFKRKITRIVGDPGTQINFALGGTGTWGSDVRQHYSRDQAWNSTGKLIFLENPVPSGGNPKSLFLDGDTYVPQFGTPSNYVRGEDRWHPARARPNVRINLKDSGNTLEWFDVVLNTAIRTWPLPLTAIGIGPGKGNPTVDGRFIALLTADRTSGYVVDMDPQPPFAPYPSVRIGPQIDLTDHGLSGIIAVTQISLSPLGTYVVVNYTGDHPRVYDFDAATLAFAPRAMPALASGCGGSAAKGFVYNIGHFDIGINPWDSNEEVIVGQEHCKNKGVTVDGKLVGAVIMIRLRDGEFTPLTDPTNEAYPRHVSLRNTDRPGWCYVTHYNSPGRIFRDELIAVKMDGSLEVERLAHCHTNAVGCYRCEEHPVPHMNGKRVMFNSSWGRDCKGGCGTQTVRQAYILDYPEC